MPRLLALAFALLLWPQSAEGGSRASLIEALAGETECVLPGSTDVGVEETRLEPDRLLIESEPDRGSRMSEGRHASPAAPFRTVLELGPAATCHGDRESGWRQRRTVPGYYATAPPRSRRIG